MTKIIKKAAANQRQFTVGQSIKWTVWSNDGRSISTPDSVSGRITKVNRITVQAIDRVGNTWAVDKTDIE